MNRRQKKKQNKKIYQVVELLNTLEIIDSDFDGESIIYISAADKMHTQNQLRRICKRLKVPFKLLQEKWLELREDYEGTNSIDMSVLFWFYEFPSKYRISYHYKKGFKVNLVKEAGSK